MHVRRARLATAVQLHSGTVASHYGDSNYVGSKVSLQTARVAEGLPDTDGSKINPKPKVITSSDGSQMVTETNNVA